MRSPRSVPSANTVLEFAILVGVGGGSDLWLLSELAAAAVGLASGWQRRSKTDLKSREYMKKIWKLLSNKSQWIIKKTLNSNILPNNHRYIIIFLLNVSTAQVNQFGANFLNPSWYIILYMKKNTICTI